MRIHESATLKNCRLDVVVIWLSMVNTLPLNRSFIVICQCSSMAVGSRCVKLIRFRYERKLNKRNNSLANIEKILD